MDEDGDTELLELVRIEKSKSGGIEEEDEAGGAEGVEALFPEGVPDVEEREDREVVDDEEVFCEDVAVLTISCTTVNSFIAGGRGEGDTGEQSGYVSFCITRSSIASISARFMESPGRTRLAFVPPSPCRMQRLAAMDTSSVYQFPGRLSVNDGASFPRVIPNARTISAAASARFTSLSGAA